MAVGDFLLWMHVPNDDSFAKWVGGDIKLVGGDDAVIKQAKDEETVESELRGEARAFEAMVEGWAGSRVLFGTERGFLGLGLEDVREGDEVWVTPYGPVPLVLRPLGEGGKGCYSLVGECYVHGVMYGEPFTGIMEPEWEKVWLE